MKNKFINRKKSALMPTEVLESKTLSIGNRQFVSPLSTFNFNLLLVLLFTTHISLAQVKNPPTGIVVDRNGKEVHKLRDLEQKFALSAWASGQEQNIFPPCCFEGNYYVAFRLYFDDPSFETPTTDWATTFTFSLYQSTTKIWDSQLDLNMGQQLVSDQVFHSQVIPFTLNSDWYIKVQGITENGNVPLEKVYLAIEFYKVRENNFDTGYDPTPVVISLAANTMHQVSWQKPPAEGIIVDRFELEWVFIDAGVDQQPTTNGAAFSQNEPMRATTLLDTYKLGPYPAGRLWYRVRYIGMNPDYPEHELLGPWSYGADVGYAIDNIEDGNNWQRVTSYAEGGKSKSVVTYYDGLLKPRQVLTNLSTQEQTMVAESRYDFEGRKTIDFLPVPLETQSFGYQQQNGFAYPSLPRHHKEAYDNGAAVPNGALAFSAADDYYNNPANTTISSSNGYPYTQVSYTNDNLGRISKQAGVGEKFKLDGTNTVNYFYGTPSDEELIWLFGADVNNNSNIGSASHYQKNLIQDANGQVSVTYTDATGKTVATGLAGDTTPNLDGLNLADYGIAPEEITIDLTDRYQWVDGSRVTVYKILNADTTTYTFNTVFRALAAQVLDMPCQACRYDVSITVTSPSGQEVLAYNATDITAVDCSSQLLQNIALTGNNTFDEIGDYTLLRTIKPHAMAYEEMETKVLAIPEVQAESATIAGNVPAIDVSQCHIDTSTIDIGETLLAEMALSDCENTKQQIISTILSGANPSGWQYDELIAFFNDYQNLSSGNEVYDHPLFCQYTACMANMESEIFDDKLFLVENWTEAIAKSYHNADNLVNVDPYFSSQLEGAAKKADLIAALDNVVLEGEDDQGNPVTRSGTIEDITNPDNTAYHIDTQTGYNDSNNSGIHFLYAELMSNPPSNYTNQIEEQRWQLYRALYLDEKRKLQKELASLNGCQALVEVYEKTNANDPQKGYPALTKDGIQQWGEGEQALEPITDEELDVLVSVLSFHCNTTFSQSNIADIKSSLENYFSDRGLPTLRYILLEDVGNDSHLSNIETILGENCPLDTSPLVIDVQCEKLRPDIAYIDKIDTDPDIVAFPSGSSCLVFSESGNETLVSGNSPLGINALDSNFLSQMYSNLNGDSWTFDSENQRWVDGNGNLKIDYCEMEAVFPSETSGRLKWIGLQGYGIKSELTSLSDFSHQIIHLTLKNNYLSGGIPDWIARLDYVDLENNNYTFKDLIPPVKLIHDENRDNTFLIETQRKVGHGATITAYEGNTISLSTSIDRGLRDLYGEGVSNSKYQWYFDPVGPWVSLNTTFEEENHTIVLENITEADEGEYWYYIINETPGLEGVTLAAERIILNVEPCPHEECGDSKPLQSCLQYSQDLFTYELSTLIAAQKSQCLDNLEADRQAVVRQQQEAYLQSEVNRYSTEYTAACRDNIDDTFTIAYTPKEYHHTLYYYNRAGNLVQTVPPGGVRYGQNGEHTYKTTYQYNSLNQLVEQQTPDHGGTDPNNPQTSIPGTTRFRYDSKGQLRLSQNAQQAFDAEFSYTKYDRQGRITEVGLLTHAVDLLAEANSSTLAALLDDQNFPDAQGYQLSEITRTYYDEQVPGSPVSFPQNYLRGRVAQIETWADETTRSTITYYSYDPHGNVKALLQEIPGLEPKRIDYAYDLVSGNVNYVFYQYGQNDSFMHRYSYDADNRITKVATSTDGLVWNQDAVYEYYPHGPLKNVQLGEKNIQQLDYYYTLQGWLKGINIPFEGNPFIQSPNFAKDEFAMTLGYYPGDFEDKTGMVDVDIRDNLWAMHTSTQGVNEADAGLYNGNIAWMNTWLDHVGEYEDTPEKGMNAMAYRYDQLNRIVKSRGLDNYDPTVGYQTRTTEVYDTDYAYDPNGNLSTLTRKDQHGLVMDDFEYQYASGRNRLTDLQANEVEVKHINNNPVSTGGRRYPNVYLGGSASVASGETVVVQATESIFIEDGFIADDGADFTAFISDASAVTAGSFTFKYDYTGNIIKNDQDGSTIDWTVYGKVAKVTLDAGGEVQYTYDAAGNRALKSITDAQANTSTTHYIRDASGNVMAVYKDGELAEQPIYGSSRLGQYTGAGNVSALSHQLGKRHYELTNHLGNAMAVVSDELYVDAEATHEAKVISTSDYYPFGLDMPGRSLSASSMYRYGFNGKEKDTDGEWGSTAHYDYGFRIYNPTIGRFLSIDPLTDKYPYYSPYQFAGNTPIKFIDIDGLEPTEARLYWKEAPLLRQAQGNPSKQIFYQTQGKGGSGKFFERLYVYEDYSESTSKFFWYNDLSNQWAQFDPNDLVEPKDVQRVALTSIGVAGSGIGAAVLMEAGGGYLLQQFGRKYLVNNAKDIITNVGIDIFGQFIVNDGDHTKIDWANVVASGFFKNKHLKNAVASAIDYTSKDGFDKDKNPLDIIIEFGIREGTDELVKPLKDEIKNVGDKSFQDIIKKKFRRYVKDLINDAIGREDSDNTAEK